MSKFKIGDRVKTHGSEWGFDIEGRTGTVICYPNLWDVGIEFDEPIEKENGVRGHTASGKGKDGHCLYVFDGQCELLLKCNNKIVITSDGTETLARLYDGNKVIKTATAKCSPEDTFDFETGARIAFNRLIEPPLSKALRNMGTTAKKCAEALKESVTSIKAKPHEYKAGDKVKVIGVRCCHGMKIGEVVTLDCVWEDGEYSKAWLTKEYAKQWYIRECDFEPYKKKPLEIEVGKKYLLKPYDEVEEHLCLSKETWDEIAKRYVVAESVRNTVCADTCYYGRWAFVPEAFEKEYIEEKPFKFEVGKQYQRKNPYGLLVIEITKKYCKSVNERRYKYKVVKGEDNGELDFNEDSTFANELTPYDLPKYYNGKVVCVSNENKTYSTVHGFTVGKVYTITDGIITSDTGWNNKISPINTLEECCAWLGNKFIPFVE